MSGGAHTLVVLHPFPMDASFWGPMWRELDTDLTLLAPEFPGFGGAPRATDPTVAGFADSVARAIRDEGGGPAVVVGLSLGGYVALALAADHPDVLAGLVLADTRAEADDADARAGRERGIDTIRIDGLDAFLDPLLARLLSPAAGPDARERARAIAERQDPDALCDALAALRDRPDRTGVLDGIGVPATVVVGADDVVTPVATAQNLAAAIPDAALVVLPDAGHLSALERPAAFAEAVRATLARITG